MMYIHPIHTGQKIIKSVVNQYRIQSQLSVQFIRVEEYKSLSKLIFVSIEVPKSGFPSRFPMFLNIIMMSDGLITLS